MCDVVGFCRIKHNEHNESELDSELLVHGSRRTGVGLKLLLGTSCSMRYALSLPHLNWLSSSKVLANTRDLQFNRHDATNFER